ncbi:MAG: hypothetical protein ABIH49_00085 [archaeon]
MTEKNMSRQTARKDKRGISIMIGYVLLISISIVLSIIVYQWIKTYVPTEPVKCADGVSISVSDISCVGNELSITIKNNGRFGVAGYFIYGADDSEQETASIDLSPYTPFGEDKGSVIYLGGENSLSPGLESEPDVFDVSSIGTIYFVEITPNRYETHNNRERFVVCGEAKIKQTVPECS